MSHLSPAKTATSRVFRLGALAISIGLAIALPGFGQVSPQDHAKHHPGQAKGTNSGGQAKGTNAGAMAKGKNGGAQDIEKDNAGSQGTAPGDEAPVNESGGGMDDMGEMMKGMGKAPPKELYPTLMSLPELTPEQREEILGRAQERMSSSVALLSEGLDRLGEAAEDEDYATMQEATAEVREALARFESGLAARRALAEGKPPRQVALQWFKSEMNLQSPQGIEASGGLVGITLFHLLTMVLLIAFALAMVGMYFFKMRRAAALFERIEGDSGSPPPGSAPPLAAPPATDKNRQLEVTQT